MASPSVRSILHSWKLMQHYKAFSSYFARPLHVTTRSLNLLPCCPYWLLPLSKNNIHTGPLTTPSMALGNCSCMVRLRAGHYLGGQLLLGRCVSGPTSPSVGPAVNNLSRQTWNHFPSVQGTWVQLLLGQTRTQIHAGSVNPVQNVGHRF